MVRAVCGTPRHGQRTRHERAGQPARTRSGPPWNLPEVVAAVVAAAGGHRVDGAVGAHGHHGPRQPRSVPRGTRELRRRGERNPLSVGGGCEQAAHGPLAPRRPVVVLHLRGACGRRGGGGSGTCRGRCPAHSAPQNGRVGTRSTPPQGSPPAALRALARAPCPLLAALLSAHTTHDGGVLAREGDAVLLAGGLRRRKAGGCGVRQREGDRLDDTAIDGAARGTRGWGDSK